MPDTVSWNLQLAVQDGHLDDVRNLMNEMVAATKQDEPGTEAYEWFLSDDGSTCHIYERYADSEAVKVHLGNFGSKFAERFLAYLAPTNFTVYGNPDAEVRTALDGFGASYLGQIGGFKR